MEGQQSSQAGTGRLFRSLRAEGALADQALPALGLDEIVGLRSVTLRREPARVVAAPRAIDPALAPPAGLSLAGSPQADAAPQVPAPAAPAAEAPAPAGPRRRARQRPGLPWWAIAMIVALPTVAAAVVEALTRGVIGWATGAVLVVTAAIGAAVVRRSDDMLAVSIPPLAFLVATLIAGQIVIPQTANPLLSQGLLITDVLGRDAAWLFGATGLALAIVAIRRRRQRP